MRAAALPPPLARLGFLRHNAVGDGRTTHEVVKSDVSTVYKMTGRLAVESISTMLMRIIHAYEYWVPLYV